MTDHPAVAPLSSLHVEYVGICIGQGVGSEWGDEDQVGYLLRHDRDGWRIADSYLSSSVKFSESDIYRCFQRITDPHPVVYRWAGRMTGRDARMAFRPAEEVSDATREEVGQ